jgi:predicted DNA-binding transcriptional regulator AlpA
MRILRLPAVMERAGLCRAAIYKAVAENRFPAPVALAPGCRARGWIESEITAHLERCVRARTKPKPKRRR